MVIAGKSTLVARLLGTDIGNLSTVGIDLTEWSFTPNLLQKKQFIFNIWDFGGQEVYYATHQCFMTRRSIYLLLWNIMDGEEGVEGLRPWLDNIMARAPNSPLLIVATHMDLVTEEMIANNYRGEMLEKVLQLTALPQYKGLNVDSITAVSCHKASREGIESLKRMIYDAAERYEHKRGQRMGERSDNARVMGERIPASYFKLDGLIHRKRQELGTRNAPQILRQGELRVLIREKGIGDIDDEEELQLAAEFLHDVGTMLHYPDRAAGLSELYFTDPRWLSDMMAVVVTVQERNPYMRKGVLERVAVPQLFRDKRFPAELFDQYLSLLNRFEIALPMDSSRILIPSMLPEKPPSEVPLFDDPRNPPLAIRRHYRIQGVPAGLWSRLIARLLQLLHEVLLAMGILAEDWLGASQLGSSDVKTSSADASSSTMAAKSQIHYWRHGLFFEHPKLFFMVRPLEEDDFGNGGVEVMTSVGPNGRHLMGLIVDQIDKLIAEWYPGLEIVELGDAAARVQVHIPCVQCLRVGNPFPALFRFEECAAQVRQQSSIKCQVHPDEENPLRDLVPELLLLDMPRKFFLEAEQVNCARDDDSKLGEGGFGTVYRGQVRGRDVAIKTFTEKDTDEASAVFKELRKEVKKKYQKVP